MYGNIKHIFFDLDDTLWDFEKNSGIVLEQLFTEYDLSQKLNTDYSTFHSAYRETNLAFWSRYYKGQIDKQYLRNNRFHETFKKFTYDNYTENLEITEHYLSRAPHGKHLKKGCLEILEYLKPNYHLHIITNGFKEIQHIKLDNAGLKTYFKNIIISEEHNLTKPDPRIFRLSEQLAGCSKEECVMIGDSLESDIEGAIGAGWKAIWLTDKTDQKDLPRIQHLHQLKEFF